jgi:6-phosphogluconolactonase (cycloisomerase 2 family)
MGLGQALLAGVSLAPAAAYGATLAVSTFGGGVYSLSFTNNKLAIAQQTNGCGTTPAWLEYYNDTQSLYCFDESWSGGGTMAQYKVGSDGKLTIAGQAKTSGNDVHGKLYGGSDGKGFIASAQ